VESSNERFNDPTTEVINRMRFSPGRYKGNPVRVLIQIPIGWQAETM
jgi:hypothetical protein